MRIVVKLGAKHTNRPIWIWFIVQSLRCKMADINHSRQLHSSVCIFFFLIPLRCRRFAFGSHIRRRRRPTTPQAAFPSDCLAWAGLGRLVLVLSVVSRVCSSELRCCLPLSLIGIKGNMLVPQILCWQFCWILIFFLILSIIPCEWWRLGCSKCSGYFFLSWWNSQLKEFSFATRFDK